MKKEKKKKKKRETKLNQLVASFLPSPYPRSFTPTLPLMQAASIKVKSY